MTKDNNHRNPKAKGVTAHLILTTFTTCVGSSMLYGYNLSVLNLPAIIIRCFLNRTILHYKCQQDYLLNTSTTQFYDNTTSSLLTTTLLPLSPLSTDLQISNNYLDDNFLYGQLNSIFIIAGAMGAFATGYIADYFGRRNGLMLNTASVIIGGIMCGPTVLASSPSLLYIGRFLIGLNCGVTVGLASMYLIEIAPTKFRGTIAACHQFAVTIGIVVGNLLTLTYTLNSETLWPVAQALTAIPAVIGLCMLPFCPESPRFLFLKRQQKNAAVKAFKKLNQTDSADEFIKEMELELQAMSLRPVFKMTKLFTHRDLRMPIIIACIVQVMQQLSGINAVVGYSGTLLSTAGVSQFNAQFCVVGIGMWNILCTGISLPLLERAGRRSLLLIPSAVLALALCMLTITITSAKLYPQLNIFALSIVSVIAVFIYIAGFALSLGPIPGFIVAEVTRQETRAAAYSISQAIQWICALLVMASYPSLNNSIGGFVFLVYLAVVISCWIFFYLYMPETQGKTFDQVATDLAFCKIQVAVKTRTTILLLANSNHEQHFVHVQSHENFHHEIPEHEYLNNDHANSESQNVKSDSDIFENSKLLMKEVVDEEEEKHKEFLVFDSDQCGNNNNNNPTTSLNNCNVTKLNT